MMSEHGPDNLSQLQKSLEALGQRHDEWRKDRDDKHRRGLNNLNVFTILRSAHEEVGLHSRFIAFLLDPEGDHGQGDLFLRLFMEECGLPGFEIDTKSAQVRCEYENIDIYITDGSKHIIIENKIWAGDQEKQIERYIEVISGKGGNIDGIPVSDDDQENIARDQQDVDQVEENNILVIYLSLGRKEPSKYSRGNWEVRGDNLVRVCDERDTSQYCKYKTLHYRSANNKEPEKDIWSWLSKSYDQVSNITNLSVAITQYREVIDKLYGRYEGSTMNFTNYLLKNPKGFDDLVKVEEISRKINIAGIMRELSSIFWHQVSSNLQQSLGEKGYENWEIYEGKEKRPSGWDRLLSGKSHGLPLRLGIRKRTNKEIYFGFEYRENNYRRIQAGIIIWDFTKDKNEKEAITQSLARSEPTNCEKFESLNVKSDISDGWWSKYIGKYSDRSLMEILKDEGGPNQSTEDSNGNIIEMAAKTFSDDFMVFFETYEKVVHEYNGKLR